LQRCHLDAVRPKCHDHRIDLVTGQNEISSIGSLSTPCRLEADPCRNTQRSGRAQVHACLLDRIASRQAELVHAAIVFTFDADDMIELCSVEIDGWWRRL